MASKEILEHELLTRRAFLITNAKLGLLSILGFRLFGMQVLNARKYTTLSDYNHIRLVIMHPPRGIIYDKNGVILAANKQAYRVMLDKRDMDESVVAINKLCYVLGLNENDKKHILGRLKKYYTSPRIPLIENISWTEVALIEENKMHLPGVYVEETKLRIYPYNEITSHFIGYIGCGEPVTSEGLYVSDYLVGKWGAEKTFEQSLSGKIGVKKIEVNAYGNYIREVGEVKSEIGKNLTLSIDGEVQKAVFDKMSNLSGSAVAFDIHTGKILSLVSTPAFDSNLLSSKVSPNYWNELMVDPFKPLINKAVSSSYPPGSIFKLITVMAALKYGVKPDFKVHCNSTFNAGGRIFHCWNKNGHGQIDMENAIKHSCNVYMYTISKIVGIERIIDTAKSFGFGVKTGIDLPNEVTGFIPDKAWKFRRFKDLWKIGDTINCSIGQGFIMSTPIQLAAFAAAIANGGKLMKPQILESANAEYEKIDIPTEYLDLIRKSMDMAINTQGGTGFGSKILDEKLQIAGKTGTSQVVSKKDSGQDLSAAHVNWNKRNHALFIGYGPVHNPKYACSVVVEHGGAGPTVAAPIGREILYEIMTKYLG